MYRVLIEKIEEVTVVKTEWQAATKEAIAAAQAKALSGEKLSYDEENFVRYGSGYAQRTVEQEKTTKILEQFTDDIDLAGVIKAINKL